MRAQAAIVWEPRGPFQITEVELEEPRDDEVLVRIEAVGICHTDLLARDGLYPSPLPLVCGHEGAGVVERVGRSVKKVGPGDRVVLAYVYCGSCANCLHGRMPYCDSMFQMNFGGTRPDGTTVLRCGQTPVFGSFMGQSSFSTHALAHERTVVKITRDVPLETMAPLGCGIQTGAGTVMNGLNPPVGSSFAIFGCGAVGLSALMAAHLAGCHPIIAVDVHPERLLLASELGATHTINASDTDPVVAVHDIAGGGVQYSVEMSGIPAVLHQAVDSLRETGICGLVGAAPYGANATIDWTNLLRGRTVRGFIQGDAISDLFIPKLIDLWSAGRFPFDRLIRYFPFAEINEAAAASEHGSVIKAVLRV